MAKGARPGLSGSSPVSAQPQGVKHQSLSSGPLQAVQEHGGPLPQPAHLHVFSSQNLSRGSSASPWPSAWLPFSPLPPWLSGIPDHSSSF